jgi:serine/threonine-protein kinase
MHRQPSNSHNGSKVPDSIRSRPEFKKFHGRLDEDELVEALKLVDTEIHERYRITRFLGYGGMGNVYLARDTKDRRDVAIKVIKQNVIDNPGLLARFDREIKATMTIEHENVIEIYDLGSFSNKRFCVMELLKGVDLNDVLKKEGPIQWEMLKSIMMQVSSAVSAAHKLDIIHRDLKPANIFLVRDGKKEKTKVLDFGMAKFIQESNEKLTATGLVVGTPSYFAPEQTTGRHDYDARVDIWAAGVLMYELLTGKLPFEGSLMDKIRKITKERPVAPRQINPGIPQEVEDIIFRCLEKLPKDRFQSMDALHAAISATEGPVKYEGSVVSEDLLVQLLQDSGEDSGQKPTLGNEKLDLSIAPPSLDTEILDLTSRRKAPQKVKRGGFFGKAVGGVVALSIAGGLGYYVYTNSERIKGAYDDHSRTAHGPASSAPSSRPPQTAPRPFMATIRGPAGATVVEITPENPLGVELGRIDPSGVFYRNFEDGREHTLEIKRRGASFRPFTVSPTRTTYTVTGSGGPRSGGRRQEPDDNGVEFGTPEVQSGSTEQE